MGYFPKNIRSKRRMSTCTSAQHCIGRFSQTKRRSKWHSYWKRSKTTSVWWWHKGGGLCSWRRVNELWWDPKKCVCVCVDCRINGTHLCRVIEVRIWIGFWILHRMKWEAVGCFWAVGGHNLIQDSIKYSEVGRIASRGKSGREVTS